MYRNIAMTIFAAVLANGCGPKVVRKADPEPLVAFYAGDNPHAVGTPIALMVAWYAWCEYPFEIEQGNREYPCKPKAHEVDVHCDNDACTFQRTGDDGYDVIPTKPGPMKATVVVTTRNGKVLRFPQRVVEVVLPTAGTAACQMVGENEAWIDITLEHDGKPIELRDTKMRIKGGAECWYMGGPTRFACPIKAPRDATFEMWTTTFKIEASARCEAAPPPT